MSWAQSLHSLLEVFFLVVEEDEDFAGPTVGVVVADRSEEATVVALEDDILETKGSELDWENLEDKVSRDRNILNI